MSRLARGRAALLVVDVQERLLAALPAAVGDQLVRHAALLVAAAHRLGLPIVVSQQYPRGLGPTVAALEAALAAGPPGAALHRLDKVEFSVVAAPGFEAIAAALGRDQWLVCGVEAHVCVFQTISDLRGRGHATHLVVDAAASRTKANWRIGQGLAAAAGATLTSTEAAVFDLLGQAGTDDFKALAKLIK